MNSLDDIWDAPVTPNSPKTSRQLDISDDDDSIQRPPKRQKKQALFYSDSEDEGGDGGLRRGVVRAPPAISALDDDVEALFADAENDNNLSFKRVETLNVAALEREAEARHRREMPLTPHAVLPSSSPTRDADKSNNKEGDKKKGKDDKKRPKPTVLNETLLVGPTGFPDLMDEVKNFKTKGKGREMEDLTRLMRVYQFWTHKLYPKTKFRDTVLRVEKLCHSKRMQVALSVWRDEAHGKTHEREADLDIDSDSDRETGNQRTTRLFNENDSERHSTPHSFNAETDQPPSSRVSSQPPTNNSDFLDDESLFGVPASNVPDFPLIAKKKVVADDDNDDEFWKALDSTSGQQLSKPNQTSVDDLDDAEMWAVLEEVTNNPPKPNAQKSQVQSAKDDGMDIDDDDMWDIIQENEKTGPPPVASTVRKQSSAADQSLAESEMGWDDMYAD